MDSEIAKCYESMKALIVDELAFLETELTNGEARLKEEQDMVKRLKQKIKSLQKQKRDFQKLQQDLSSRKQPSSSNPASDKNDFKPPAKKLENAAKKKVFETKTGAQAKRPLRTLEKKIKLETPLTFTEREKRKAKQKSNPPKPVISNIKTMIEKENEKLKFTSSDSKQISNSNLENKEEKEKLNPETAISDIKTMIKKEKEKLKFTSSDSKKASNSNLENKEEKEKSKLSSSDSKQTPNSKLKIKEEKVKPKPELSVKEQAANTAQSSAETKRGRKKKDTSSQSKIKAQLDKRPNQQKLKNMVVLSTSACWDLVADNDSSVLKGIQKSARLSFSEPKSGLTADQLTFSPMLKGMMSSTTTESAQKKRVSFAAQNVSAFFNTSSPPISLDTSGKLLPNYQFDGSFLSTIKAEGTSQAPIDLTIN